MGKGKKRKKSVSRKKSGGRVKPTTKPITGKKTSGHTSRHDARLKKDLKSLSDASDKIIQELRELAALGGHRRLTNSPDMMLALSMFYSGDYDKTAKTMEGYASSFNDPDVTKSIMDTSALLQKLDGTKPVDNGVRYVHHEYGGSNEINVRYDDSPIRGNNFHIIAIEQIDKNHIVVIKMSPNYWKKYQTTVLTREDNTDFWDTMESGIATGGKKPFKYWRDTDSISSAIKAYNEYISLMGLSEHERYLKTRRLGGIG
jgi:hypothetical protein